MCENCGCKLREDVDGAGLLCIICDDAPPSDAERQAREDHELRTRLALWVRG